MIRRGKEKAASLEESRPRNNYTLRAKVTPERAWGQHERRQGQDAVHWVRLVLSEYGPQGSSMRLLLSALGMRAGHKRNSMRSFVSLRTLEKDTDLSRHTVIAGIRTAIELGWLDSEIGRIEGMPEIGGSPVRDGIMCGDFDVGYELVRVGPMTMIRDDISVKGKVSFYTAQRFGGRLVDNDAIKVLRA